MAAIWDRVQTLVFGAAVGRAGSEAVTPVLEPVRQKAWLRNKVRVLGVGHAAELIARGFATVEQLTDEAARNGYNAVRLEALAQLSQTYPDQSTLGVLQNRNLLAPALIDKALSRHGLPAEYHAAIKAAFSDILSPGELAAAIHRGLVPDPGLLKGEQPVPPFNVEAYPVYPIDAVKESAGSGYDRDRLGVLVGLQGLPMGTHEAAQAFYKGIITHGDYIRAFNESNSRNEWAQAVLENTRQIPTARDFFENALRGYHDLGWAQEQAARHGMSPDDALVIYQNQGRPMNVRNITQALARGGTFKPEQGEIKDPYMAAIVEGNLKPAYYDLEYARRYNYPSAFVFRTLQQNKAITRDQAEQYYKELGWPPELAKQAADAYAKPTAAPTQDSAVKSAETKFLTAIHKATVGGAITSDQAKQQLALTSLSAQAQAGVLDYFEKERALQQIKPPAA